MIRIQKRDLELLIGLSKYGILSTHQVAEWYFKGVDKHTVLRRLRLLKEYKIILNPSSLPNGMKAWSISKIGAKCINAADPFRYSNKNTTHHDVTLSSVRKQLEEAGIAHDWTSDMEMKRELGRNREDTSIVPDGLFLAEILNKNAVVAIELELFAKSHQRYLSIFNDYIYKSAITHIFYVVETFSIAKTLFSLWPRRRKHPFNGYHQKLLVCVRGELFNNIKDTKIYSATGIAKPLIKTFKNNLNCPPPLSHIEHSLGKKAI